MRSSTEAFSARFFAVFFVRPYAQAFPARFFAGVLSAGPLSSGLHLRFYHTDSVSSPVAFFSVSAFVAAFSLLCSAVAFYVQFCRPEIWSLTFWDNFRGSLEGGFYLHRSTVALFNWSLVRDFSVYFSGGYFPYATEAEPLLCVLPLGPSSFHYSSKDSLWFSFSAHFSVWSLWQQFFSMHSFATVLSMHCFAGIPSWRPSASTFCLRCIEVVFPVQYFVGSFPCALSQTLPCDFLIEFCWRFYLFIVSSRRSSTERFCALCIAALPVSAIASAFVSAGLPAPSPCATSQVLFCAFLSGNFTRRSLAEFIRELFAVGTFYGGVFAAAFPRHCSAGAFCVRAFPRVFTVCFPTGYSSCALDVELISLALCSGCLRALFSGGSFRPLFRSGFSRQLFSFLTGVPCTILRWLLQHAL